MSVTLIYLKGVRSDVFALREAKILIYSQRHRVHIGCDSLPLVSTTIGERYGPSLSQ